MGEGLLGRRASSLHVQPHAVKPMTPKIIHIVASESDVPNCRRARVNSRITMNDPKSEKK
jgi:hypothetical protein